MATTKTVSVTKVVALVKGHDGNVVREVGEEFEINLADPKYDGVTWFEPVDKGLAEARARENEQREREREQREREYRSQEPRPPARGPARQHGARPA